MKIAIIGAGGNLGKRVTKQALGRGHEVLAILRNGDSPDRRVQILRKNLFELSREDLFGCDAIISAFGSGFKADPAINLEAFRKYIELVDHTEKHLIAIGGAGSLFTDSTHSLYEYESPGHPDFLKDISMSIKLGIDELKKTEQINWTAVCPSRSFDADGVYTGDYLIGTEEEIIYNEDGNSYVTYDDLAKAMIDIAEEGSFRRMKITVATRKIPQV